MSRWVGLPLVLQSPASYSNNSTSIFNRSLSYSNSDVSSEIEETHFSQSSLSSHRTAHNLSSTPLQFLKDRCNRNRKLEYRLMGRASCWISDKIWKKFAPLLIAQALCYSLTFFSWKYIYYNRPHFDIGNQGDFSCLSYFVFISRV